MVLYYLVLLRIGDKWTPEVTPETQKIREGHFANIEKMRKDGKLILAGPFDDGKETPSPGDLNGLFLLAVDSMDEARALYDRDPSIKSGRNVAEIHPWWGPKGIRFGT
jgi:uncharacterized protein YciI